MALAAAATGLWMLGSAMRRRERQRALARGERRALHSEWQVVDGLRMHARVARHAEDAAATALVFVHGWGVSGSYFRPTAERLAATHDVHVPDLPGHGRSATPSRAPGIGGLSDALIGWMAAAGLARAVLVGQSMGCAVAVETARRRPDLVERLVLIGPTPDPRARGVALPLLRLLASAPFERWSLAGVIARDYARMGRRLWPEFFAMQAYPIEQRMAGLTAPTLLVSGARDALVPRRWLQLAARLTGSGEPLLIPRWGHAVQYSAPAQLTAALCDFLEAGRRDRSAAGEASASQRARPATACRGDGR
jgi:2-hydroxy-6-oxonona-2,4-dienedioate hydrolase